MGVAWAALYCHGLPWGGLGWLRLPWAALGWLRLPWGELGCLGLPGGLELPWGGLGCLGVRRLGWSGHTKIIFIFEKIKQIKVNYINSNQYYFEPKGVFVPQLLWAGSQEKFLVHQFPVSRREKCLIYTHFWSCISCTSSLARLQDQF